MSDASRPLHLLVGLVLLQSLLAWGQNLVVNGQPVDGLTLLQGSSYAPADGFGAALGADTFYDAVEQTVTFELAGRLLSVRLGDGDGAVSLDGVAVAAEGAVRDSGLFYVPVKAVVTALGGVVTFLQSQQTVMAVLPRATLRQVTVDRQRARGYERFVLNFDGLTSFESYFNPALGTLQLRFGRADLASAQTFTGDFFTTAVITPNAGYLDFRVSLKPGYRFETYTSPRVGGFTLVVDVLPDTATSAAIPVARPLVVIDPGHGGGDDGLKLGGTLEKTLTLRFAQALADALSAYAVDVRLTRRDDVALPLDLRSQAGIGARLFVSLHVADLPEGRFNLYYLGDPGADGSLSVALRENAAAALNAADTDALRRRILLDLVPDLALGERYARDLNAGLATAALQADLVTPAPLAVLNGAAGRGVLLELSPADLADDKVAASLAAALVAALTAENGN